MLFRAGTMKKMAKINTEIFHKNYVIPHIYIYIYHYILEHLSEPRDLILF